MSTLPNLDTATAPDGLPVATEIRWYAAKTRRDGFGYQMTTKGMEEWADTIEADAAKALAEVDRLRAALEAIVRAHTPGRTCIDACDTSRDIDADCTCGYIDACDPGDFAASVLAGEWSP